jgi:hypothetical protein
MSFSFIKRSFNFNISSLVVMTALVLASNVSFCQTKTNRVITELKKSSLDQQVNGIRVSGFGDSPTLLCVIKLNSSSKDCFLSINNSKDLTLSFGLSSWRKLKEIAFTGTESQINNALSTLIINTANKDGNIRLQLGVTINPIGHGFNLQDGRFYEISAGLLDFNNKLSGELPVFTNSEYSFKTF